MHEVEDEDDAAAGPEDPVTKKAFIDTQASKLGMLSAPEPVYPSTIYEGDLDESGTAPLELAQQYADAAAPLHQRLPDPLPLPQAQRFSTHKTSRTLSLALEMVGYDGGGAPLYMCICQMDSRRMDSCRQICLSPAELLEHVRIWHRGLVPLQPSPMRLLCPRCYAFYAERLGGEMCTNAECGSGQALAVNICGEWLEV